MLNDFNTKKYKIIHIQCNSNLAFRLQGYDTGCVLQ